MGLIAEGEGVAVQVLDGLGVDRTELREAVLDAMAEISRLPPRYSSQGGTTFTAEPVVRCPGCDFEFHLVGAPQELQIRIERNDTDPWFRIYLASGGAPEYLPHECGPESAA